jgi:holin-like protein
VPVAYITLLLVCQLTGEVTVRLLNLPLPGPVLGMLLLFAYLMVKGHVPEGLDAVTKLLLGNLSLLFVPASVGIMVYAGLIADQWLPIAVSLVASTAIAIAVTGLVMKWLTGDRQ